MAFEDATTIRYRHGLAGVPHAANGRELPDIWHREAVWLNGEFSNCHRFGGNQSFFCREALFNLHI
jgi:hypothetical protein